MSGAFYLDEETVRRAVLMNRSCNLIYFESAFKVDLFFPSKKDFGWRQLARRKRETISPVRSQDIDISTAEDIILAKMLCDVKGGAVSTTQWADILGVVKVQGDELDLDYLRESAADLALTSLLESALAEAG